MGLVWHNYKPVSLLILSKMIISDLREAAWRIGSKAMKNEEKS